MALLIRCLLALLLLAALPASAAGEFVALCYHEVEPDDAAKLERTAIRVGDLAAQFAWLQANGYHPVSVQQVVAARGGGPQLPDKAVLLTFDDGRRDVYTRVFPLLKLFRYPAVVALVGAWLDVPAGGTVDYDGRPEPRGAFLDWEEVGEMQRSGLVEIASHSHGLHRGIPANPQGNTQPAAVTREFAAGGYESDAAYLARLREDLRRNRDLIAARTGVAPRVIVWPYGRSNGETRRIADELGLTVGMTLVDGINDGATPLPLIKRYLIERSPSLQGYAEALRQVWQPDPARSVRIAPGAWPDAESGLAATLDPLQRIAPNIAFVDPRATGADDGPVLFPTARRPLATDSLNRIAWQIERRAGVPVFIDLPAAWLHEPELLGDLARQVNFSGVRVVGTPDDPAVAAALITMGRWRWPLRVAYAPAAPVAAAWDKLPPGDLIVVPAESGVAALPGRLKTRLLVEFDAKAQPPAAIADAMRRLEADGWRQFGVADFPDAGAEAVWRELSLRSQPLVP